MKLHYSPRRSAIARWQQRSLERLGQAVQQLLRLLVLDRHHKMALIPIPVQQRQVRSQRHQKAWRD